MKRIKAFTLAEVLIVLGIIGIIAELTIPDLMQNVENQDIIAGLKTAYSILSQAYIMSVNENGTPDTWGITDSDNYTNDGGTNLFNKFQPYLKLDSDCQGASTSTSNCYPLIKFSSGDTVDYNSDDYHGHYKAHLINGMYLIFWSGSANCSLSYGNTPALSSVCGAIHVDVNGAKGPNTWGKDYFQFYVTMNGIIPAGGSAETGDNAFSKECQNLTSHGWGCTAWIIQNSNRDYLKSCGTTLSWNGPTTCN